MNIFIIFAHLRSEKPWSSRVSRACVRARARVCQISYLMITEIYTAGFDLVLVPGTFIPGTKSLSGSHIIIFFYYTPVWVLLLLLNVKYLVLVDVASLSSVNMIHEYDPPVLGADRRRRWPLVRPLSDLCAPGGADVGRSSRCGLDLRAEARVVICSCWSPPGSRWCRLWEEPLPGAHTRSHLHLCVHDTHARRCNTLGERAGSARGREMWSACTRGVAVVSSGSGKWWSQDGASTSRSGPRRMPPKRPHSQRSTSGPRVPAAPSASGLIPVSTGRHWRGTTAKSSAHAGFSAFHFIISFLQTFFTWLSVSGGRRSLI